MILPVKQEIVDKMEMKQLNLKEREELYKKHLSKDFHKDEVKPFEMIEALITQNKYRCYGFFENEVQMGYGYFTKAPNGKAILLDYLVVFEQNRNKGLGSVFLGLVKERLQEEGAFLLAEVENPEFAPSERERTIRQRRIIFYQRNGFGMTKVRSRIFQDNYHIIFLPLKEDASNELALLELNQIYQAVFGGEFLKKNTKVELEA